jgi:hypothetical protein
VLRSILGVVGERGFMGCIVPDLTAAAFIIIMKMVQHGQLGLLSGARNTQE